MFIHSWCLFCFFCHISLSIYWIHMCLSAPAGLPSNFRTKGASEEKCLHGNHCFPFILFIRFSSLSSRLSGQFNLSLIYLSSSFFFVSFLDLMSTRKPWQNHKHKRTHKWNMHKGFPATSTKVACEKHPWNRNGTHSTSAFLKALLFR